MLLSLSIQSIKNSFYSSYISFKVILYKCKYRFSCGNNACEQRRRKQSKEYFKEQKKWKKILLFNTVEEISFLWK